MLNESIVGDFVELNCDADELFRNIECCDCADPETGSENCMCEDF